ncbi:hypothetical protein GLOIN_2v1630101 [Rhizophagus irregularis DAOM 181602=DAOM 197198]|uniref:Uncharacterized protein n=1 Tax=Rhizophagus irregularis (strain DAOM 181602 / DAOM 197198 / MUCL 43194) TaxID=747089 RepID=A0A2P4PUW4_RHIID|nr:hypothetical protein GLOIN_2v1630101 [Rhizophagus irregularis DAOM 181602=DAOM 197198]POG69140.1 hypothetical protein GLOIN_2v1630101 [Rhizophagus irregularis DAOM 181602=DAOM 197198]|eukprot:XP_025176006.1 hypothetical protein GLOIN_2v1630101 [Rhizophagus irregularis DAOM 181602=DAOM 197198]
MNVLRFILMIIKPFNYLLENPPFKYGIKEKVKHHLQNYHFHHLREFLNIFGRIILMDQCKFNLWKLVIKNSH